jgi:hypothetical protein
LNNSEYPSIGSVLRSGTKGPFFERTTVNVATQSARITAGYTRVTGERSGPAGGPNPLAGRFKRLPHGQHSPVPPVTVARHRFATEELRGEGR